MANKIRGITIELGADTSGIVKGLKASNSEIKNTQKQLKDVERLLKLNPTSMTLLNQKTQLLQQNIGETKNKLDKLKDAEKTMKAQGIDENSEQFMALQREIIATEQELKKLESTAGSGSAVFNAISITAGKIGEGLESAGKKLLPVTAGITALGGAAISAFKEVDAGADTVIKKTGLTGEAAEEVREIYESVATKVSGSFEDVGKAVGEVATRFGASGTELQSLSEEFLKFAKVTDQDAETAVINVSQALKTFGLDASDAEGVLGILAKTGQDTGISIDTLESSLQSYGPTLKEMGFGIGESVQLLGQFEANGLDANSMMSKLTKGAAEYNLEGENMQEGLTDLIDRLQNSGTEADATAQAYEIFGKKGGLAFVTAAKEGKLSFKNLSGDLSDYKNVVNETYDEIIDETDKMELIWKETKITLADAGKSILTSLAPAIQKVGEFVKNLSERWKGLDDSTKQTIIKFAGIAAAVGPALIVFGKLATAIGSITRVMSTLKFASMITNPVTLAVGALTALVGVVAGSVIEYERAVKASNPYREELDRLKESSDKLRSSFDETNSKFDEAATGADTEAAAAESLYGKLEDLVGIEDKTAGQKQAIVDLVNELNEIVPDLNLKYDEQRDALNKTNGEIQTHIDLMRDQAKAEATMEALTQAYKDQAQAEMDLNDAQKVYNDLMDGSSEGVQAYADALANGGDGLENFLTDLEYSFQLTDKEIQDAKHLAEAQEELNAANDNYSTSLENVTKWEEANAQQTEALAKSQANNAKTLNSIKLDRFKTELQSALGDKYTQTLDDAINNASKAGVEIPDKLKTGLLDGSVSIEEGTSQINKLVREKLAENKDQVEKIGKETSSANASGIASGKNETARAAKLNKDEALTQFSLGKKPAATHGAGVSNAFASSILNGKGAANNNAASVRLSAVAGMSDTSRFSSLGTDAGLGYANGMKSSAVMNSIATAAAAIVSHAKARIQSSQNSASPAKEFMPLGEDGGDGYAVGFLNSKKLVGENAASLVETARGALSGPTGLLTSGTGIPSVTAQAAAARTAGAAYNFTQNNYSPRALTASEIYRQTNNLFNYNKAVTV